MDNNNPSRRSVLKTIGIASTTTLGFTGIITANNDSVEIITGVKGDEPISYQAVPKEWYHHVKEVRTAQSELLNEIINISNGKHKGVFKESNGKKRVTDRITVSRTSATEKIGGLTKYKLKVPANKPGRANRITPDHVNGIPVEVEGKPDEVHLDDHYDGDPCHTKTVETYVRGGDAISAAYVDGSIGCNDTWGRLTITCGVTQNGSTRIMTSAHGFFDDDRYADINGQIALQGDNCHGSDIGDTMGTVQDFDHSLDFATISTDMLDSNVGNWIVDGPGIGGHVTEDGLDYLESSWESCRKFGRTTCETGGSRLGYN